MLNAANTTHMQHKNHKFLEEPTNKRRGVPEPNPPVAPTLPSPVTPATPSSIASRTHHWAVRALPLFLDALALAASSYQTYLILAALSWTLQPLLGACVDTQRL
eukprot:m.1639699 g.1639699  ORF g.1639699 m.1639699 type:complete len:104 (-) comp37456_c0_seq1:1179-1490(-)